MDQILSKTHAKGIGSFRLFAFVAGGYLLFNRTFAYVGIPALKIFIGETVLGIVYLFRGVRIFRTFRRFAKSSAAGFIAFSLIVYFTYGLLQVLHGLLLGHPRFDVLRDFASVYYTLFLLIGIYIASKINDPFDKLRDFAYGLALVNGIYGILYIAYLGQLSHLTIPGTPNVWIFAQPTQSAVFLLMLIAFFPMKRSIIVLIILNTLVLLGAQIRAEWLGFAAALFTFALLNRRFNSLLQLGALIFSILLIAYVLDIRLVSPAGRGGELSTRGLIGRVLAPIDPEAAWLFTEHVQTHEGTYLWRVIWWTVIWEAAFSSAQKFLIGNGFGFDLAALAGYGEATGLGGLRTPHSFIAYTVGYAGILGFIAFLMLHISFLRYFLKNKEHPNPESRKCAKFGLTIITFWLVHAAFCNFFEAPFGAIPYYLTCGLLMGIILSTPNSFAKPRQVNSGAATNY